MNTPPRSPERQKPKRPPYPVHVRLVNPFPLLAAANCRLPVAGMRQKKKWYRPEHSTKLLKAVKLELTVQGDDQERRVVVYTAVGDTKTMCPSWRHINESRGVNNWPSDLSVDAYETITARLSVVGDAGEEQHQSENGGGSSSNGSKDGVFLEVPIHPKKLLRIARLPTNLPLNCLVVEFTDHSIRIQPLHYHLLLESQQDGVVVERNAQLGASFLTNNDSHFEDDVFSTLDTVTPPRRQNSTLDDEVGKPHQSATATDEENNFVDDAENDCEVQDLLKEQAYLESLLQEEEALLAHETSELLHDKERLQVYVTDILTKKKQNLEVEKAIGEERDECRRNEFLLEAQRIRLIRELAALYPVTVQTDRRYLIRELEIPADLSAGSVPEEVLSAALGYLCHAVHMMSKYLGVHLRYRLTCFGSRSTVHDDCTAKDYPLYLQGRQVEREQVEHGVRLLTYNVECICNAREIRISPKLHILAIVKRIYESVIDGY